MFAFIDSTELGRVQLPLMVRVRQRLPFAPLKGNIDCVISERFESASIWGHLTRFKGEKVAIGVGSRGIDRLPEVVKSVVTILKRMGMDPFIVPAMGSHGGSTEEGQKRILTRYGITEESMGCPVISSKEVVQLDCAPGGVPVYFDKEASQCSVVVAINRIKPHPEISGEIESGILKMLAIGFGKWYSASTLHRFYSAEEFPSAITEIAHLIINHFPLVIGVGLLEDGYGQLSEVSVMTGTDIEAEEKKLLKKAKDLLPRLPFSKIDILIVDEMGKDISGSGVDTNVIGRKKQVNIDIRYIVVRDLTLGSCGNAAGIGLVDIITERLFQKIDFVATYTNCLASRALDAAKIPLVAKTDEMAIKLALSLMNRDPKDIHMVRIKNTATLGIMEISEGLANRISESGRIEKCSEPFQYQFSNAGELLNQLDTELPEGGGNA